MRILLAFTASLFMSLPATAHHSFNAHYDASKSVTIEGEVTEFRFENPHSRFYLKVNDEGGDEVIWLVEMGARNGMIRDGWTQDHLKPGDVVRVTGAPGRKEPNILHRDTITTLDGEPVGPPED